MAELRKKAEAVEAEAAQIRRAATARQAAGAAARGAAEAAEAALEALEARRKDVLGAAAMEQVRPNLVHNPRMRRWRPGGRTCCA